MTKIVYRSTANGLVLVALAGLIAVGALTMWPKHRHEILADLGLAWLLIRLFVMERAIPGALSASIPGIYRKIQETGYRSSISSTVVTLMGIILVAYGTFSSWQ